MGIRLNIIIPGESVLHAQAAAALSSRKPGARISIPRREETGHFLEEQLKNYMK